MGLITCIVLAWEETQCQFKLHKSLENLIFPLASLWSVMLLHKTSFSDRFGRF